MPLLTNLNPCLPTVPAFHISVLAFTYAVYKNQIFNSNWQRVCKDYNLNAHYKASIIL